MSIAFAFANHAPLSLAANKTVVPSTVSLRACSSVNSGDNGRSADSSRAHAPPRIPRRSALRLLLLPFGAALATSPLSFIGGANAELGRVNMSDAEWRTKLSPNAYSVLRQAGTERPFTSPLLGEHRPGVFVCAGCGSSLFDSKAKYESGTGWPSFYAALPNALSFHPTPMDRALLRTEVRCAECDGHLGHVFADGPRPTGKRFCINGVALDFLPSEQ